MRSTARECADDEAQRPPASPDLDRRTGSSEDREAHQRTTCARLNGTDAAHAEFARSDPDPALCPVDATRCATLPEPNPTPHHETLEDNDSAGAPGNLTVVPSMHAHAGDNRAEPPAPPPMPAVPAVPAGPSDADVALDHVRGGIGLLRDVPLWTLAQRDLLTLTREVERAARRLFGIQVRLAGEVHERGIAGTLDVRSTAHLLHETLNITMSDARGRVAAAVAGLSSETPSGTAIDPVAPDLLVAIDAGELSPGHAKVITHCLSKIPLAVDVDVVEACRRTLIEQAGLRDEMSLRQMADKIQQIVDPDGSLSGKDPEDRAELHIGTKREDGLTPIRGLLSPLTAEQFRVAIEALAAPKPVDEGTPDDRPAGLRREQALGEILHRHLTSGTGPREGGVRPQVVVTIAAADLFGTARRGGTAPTGDGQPPNGWMPPDGWSMRSREGDERSGHSRGSAWSDYDGTQSVAFARLLACDSAIIPQVLGGDSVVLDQGRGVRLFTAEQRRAITTRDKGCAFPGCDIPPAWCESHHIIWWSVGGSTDITNGVLLCRRHHVLIHRGGWRIDAGPDGARPWFVPPAHIDPARTPRRNAHFHLPEPVMTVRRQ